ncbi:MAG TPA: hypothetical protein VLG76_03930 [Rhabdochlamydiaceae bacterium]|nr:hypothetical protein [Rhabdochlamydiaceae bacterium]
MSLAVNNATMRIMSAASETHKNAVKALKVEKALVQDVFNRVRNAIPVPYVRALIAAIPATVLALVLAVATIGFGVIALLLDFIRHLCGCDCSVQSGYESESDDEGIDEAVENVKNVGDHSMPTGVPEETHY